RTFLSVGRVKTRPNEATSHRESVFCRLDADVDRRRRRDGKKHGFLTRASDSTHFTHGVKTRATQKLTAAPRDEPGCVSLERSLTVPLRTDAPRSRPAMLP